jgi:hypothetical protein
MWKAKIREVPSVEVRLQIDAALATKGMSLDDLLRSMGYVSLRQGREEIESLYAGAQQPESNPFADMGGLIGSRNRRNLMSLIAGEDFQKPYKFQLLRRIAARLEIDQETLTGERIFSDAEAYRSFCAQASAGSR